MEKFDVIKWMTENGHPGYAAEIAVIEGMKPDILASPFADIRKLALDFLNDKIEQVRQEAQDRYDDWKTDPLD